MEFFAPVLKLFCLQKSVYQRINVANLTDLRKAITKILDNISCYRHLSLSRSECILKIGVS